MNFSDAWPLISPIEGWLTKQEAEVLFNEASRIGENETILEVGSYKGRSAISFALTGREVTCVDPYQGEPRFKNALAPFIENTKAFKNIVLHISRIENFRSENKYKLIYIDANHIWPDPYNDFMWAKLWAEKDAIVLFHDYNHHGVERTIDRLITEKAIAPLSLTGTVFKARVK